MVMRATLLVVVAALVSSISTVATSSAMPAPNLRVRVAAPAICSGDMPCDPPVKTSLLVLSRAGAIPIRVRVNGPGTVWLHVHVGFYSVRVGSVVAPRIAVVRVPSTGIATVRIVLPA